MISSESEMMIAHFNYATRLNMKIRVFEAFAGYGSQAMALNRLQKDFPNFEYEVVGISEIDRYALQAYNAVHGHCPNYGDISKIDWNKVPDFDLLTYSFPCTDISNAGQQKGLEEGSGTRSSLLWECRKAIETKKPKYLLMENVKALMSDKFKPFLIKWEQWLASQGYANFTQVLNAKNYGVHQNRERVFMVSIRTENVIYYFPKPFELKTRLKDVLEHHVDEKYYLSERMLQGFIKTSECKEHGHNFAPKDGGGLLSQLGQLRDKELTTISSRNEKENS